MYGTAGPVSADNPELIFVKGEDDQVYELALDGNGDPAGSYSLTSPGHVKTISTSPQPRGINALFAVGLDSQLYDQTFDNNGTVTTGYSLTAPGQIME
jgi:hypothetical protein